MGSAIQGKRGDMCSWKLNTFRFHVHVKSPSGHVHIEEVDSGHQDNAFTLNCLTSRSPSVQCPAALQLFLKKQLCHLYLYAALSATN